MRGFDEGERLLAGELLFSTGLLLCGELFDEFFPGRDDVVRLLMEPITYANGSTLEDPAITYGIVFSNFMQKGEKLGTVGARGNWYR